MRFLSRGKTKDRGSYDLVFVDQYQQLDRMAKIALFEDMHAAAKSALTELKQYADMPDGVAVSQKSQLAARATRSLFHLIVAAPFLTPAFQTIPLVSAKVSEVTKENAVTSMCVSLQTQSCFEINEIKSDLAHISKIMHRYHLDFDNAFNFWLLRNALKGDDRHEGYGDNKISSAGVDRARLMTVGQSLGLTPSNVAAILPAFEAKINRSKTAVLGQHQKNGLFASSEDYTAELARVAVDTRNKLRM